MRQRRGDQWEMVDTTKYNVSILSLSHGEAVFIWPKIIHRDDRDDILQWIDMALRSIQRSMVDSAPAKEQAAESASAHGDTCRT